ncbi:MAG TPA: AbrB/MazE/SpoVT family DNA-binding domain-containing protein [Chloroflexia bacterium]|nr:AbrB/MazE/SpoVT family DNA-binding domain-containing protein [Chloroflexia bacterium]
MRQRIGKWGNSLSVRIPKGIAEELHLQEDSEVEVSVEEARLIIAPVARPVYSLDQLLSGVTSENLHNEMEWGPSAGKEVW